MNVSIFERVDLVNEPRDIDIDVALSRIRVPKDGIRAIVEQVMMAPDKDTRGRLKKRLPVVTFGGTFEKRAVGGLKHGSGLMIIDLDDVDATKAKEKMSKDKHVYAAWISPSGTGLKYLVRIPIVTDDSVYKSYYYAWQEYSSKYGYKIDDSGKDVSRACYESFDEDIYVNKSASVFSSKLEEPPAITDEDKFNKLKKWAYSHDTPSEGNRNNFYYKLASACNRFGVDDGVAEQMIGLDTNLPTKEISLLIKSAYKKSHLFGSETFDSIAANPPKSREKEKEMKGKLERFINPKEINATLVDFYMGNAEYLRGISTGIKFLDNLFLFKTNEFYQIIAHSSIGKTFITLWWMLLAAKVANWKIAIATTENSPEETKNILINFYCSLYADKNYRYEKSLIEEAMSFVDKHFMLIDTTGATIWDMMDAVVAAKEEKGIEFDALFLDPLNSFSFGDTRANSDHSIHQEQAAGLLSFSTKVCSVFLTTHTITNRQREGSVPSIADAEYGSVYANKAHVTMAYHRNPYAASAEKNTTEIYIYKQRSKFMRGGDVTDRDHPIIMQFSPGTFSFDVKYEDMEGVMHEEDNPMI